MDQREELAALRRLAELEAKAGKAAPPAKVTGDQMRAFAGTGKKPVSGGMDALKGGASGLYTSLVSMAPQLMDGPLRTIRQAADVAGGIMDARQGRRPQLSPTATASPGAPGASATAGLAGQNYTPQTRGGRWAKTAGAMLPALAAPGTIPQRLLNVVGPTIGAEGSAEVVKAFGGGDQAQEFARMVGGTLGGVGVNVRAAPRRTAGPALPKADAEAMRYVNNVAGKTPLDSLRAAPGELLGAEALGQPGKAALGALSRRQGSTGDALKAEVSTRQLGRPGRLLDAFASTTGAHPEAAAGDLQKLVDAGRLKAAPLYEQAYAAGPIDTPALRSLSSRPSVKSALGKAVAIAAEEDISPMDLGLEVSPASGDLPEMIKITTPTAKTWDYVKRGLDDVMEGYRDKTTGKLVLDEKGRATLATLKALREELTTANPAYGKALAESGDYLSSETAFRDAGRDIFNTSLTERQLAARLGKLSESSREAYKAGIANRFYDLAQNGRLDPKVLKTGRVRAKLRMALGNEAADRLIQLSSQEGDMLAFERRYAPDANSVTQEMAAAQAEQDAMGGKGAQFLTDMFTQGPRRALGTQVRSGLDAIGPTRGMAPAIRDKAGEALMLSPDELAKALQAYRDQRPKGPPSLTISPDPRLVSLLTGRP